MKKSIISMFAVFATMLFAASCGGMKDTSESCRIFSLDEDISKYEVVSGRLPEKADEIAFADADKDNYQIGDQITFEEKAPLPPHWGVPKRQLFLPYRVCRMHSAHRQAVSLLQP